MELTSLRTLYKDIESVDKEHVRIGGWVRSIRASKNFGFIMLSDGTFFEPVQIVYDDKLDNFAEISKYNVGSALIIEGRYRTRSSLKALRLRIIRFRKKGTV